MIDTIKDKRITKKQPALERFHYANGYHLEGTDFGPMGVRIEMSHPHEGRQALILPPEKVREYALWLMRTLKYPKQTKAERKKAPTRSAQTKRRRAS